MSIIKKYHRRAKIEERANSKVDRPQHTCLLWIRRGARGRGMKIKLIRTSQSFSLAPRHHRLARGYEYLVGYWSTVLVVYIERPCPSVRYRSTSSHPGTLTYRYDQYAIRLFSSSFQQEAFCFSEPEHTRKRP